jgi:hypothetical protein
MEGSQARTAHGGWNGKLVRVFLSLMCGWFVAAAPNLKRLPMPVPRPPFPQTILSVPSRGIESQAALETLPPAQRQPVTRFPVFQGVRAPRPAITNSPEWIADDLNPPLSTEITEKSLLPLLAEERRLLQFCGPEHPDLLDVRERIREIRAYLQRHHRAPSTTPEGRPTLEPPRPLPVPITLIAYELLPAPALPLPSGSLTGPTSREVLPPPSTQEHVQGLPSEKKAGQLREIEPPVGNRTGPSAVPVPAMATGQGSGTVAAQQGNLADGGLIVLSGLQLGMGGTLVSGLVVHLLGLVVILRWHGKWFVRRMQKEYGAMPVGNPTAPPIAPAFQVSLERIEAPDLVQERLPEDRFEERMEELADEGTAERFELGPTYEEEMRMRQEAERQREEALVRQMFEDNLRLRQQLAQLPAEAS